jgi:hypothetical protein
LDSGAETPSAPHVFPPRKKLPKKKALTEATDLSVFDILNIFHCCWFLFQDHHWAYALSAQKAKDGKIIWVEFALQFYTHLVHQQNPAPLWSAP